jgi:DNA-binding CsgD family transcriptional regulator
MNNTISPREREILYLTAWEHNSKEIAKELFLSEHTVVTHRKNLLSNMDAKNTAGLIRKAFETGILAMQSPI